MAVQMFGDDADEFLQLCDWGASDRRKDGSKTTASFIEYAIRIAAQANSESRGNPHVLLQF